MVVTASDIGHHVEKSLTRIFKTAVSWQCILLIDEADVFMERRTTADLDRNSLVAGKLTSLFLSKVSSKVSSSWWFC